MPDQTISFIAELADELADMADDEGLELLSYLLRMAVLEARRSKRSETGLSETAKRISYH